MKHLVVNHKVTDYNAWRKEFDKDESVRTKYQVKVESVLRDRKDPNQITVVAGVPDYESADRFIQSPELKQAMSKAGVVGVPEVQLCEDC